MAFIPFPPGVVEVLTRFNVAGIPGENTLGVKFVSGAATYTDGVALLAAIAASYTANLYAHVTPDVTYTELVANDLTSASGWQAVLPLGVAGSASGASVQSQVAMVITLQTAKRGRSYRGRNYVPALPVSALFDSKSWETSILTLWDDIYADIIADIETAGWTPCILSRIQDHVALILGIATPITVPRANAKLGTQRRRLT